MVNVFYLGGIALENIKDKMNSILQEIKKAHKNSSFSSLPYPNLVAVSKKQSEERIDLAINSGQKCFGENRVQEAQQRWSKRLEINKDIELRLIGPLQSNKVKQALKLFDIIETIDREKLANEILSAFKEEGSAVKKRVDTHKMAEANKAFSHFRF